MSNYPPQQPYGPPGQPPYGQPAYGQPPYPQQAYGQQPPPQGGGCFSCMGCGLIVLLLLLLACGGGAVYLYYNGPNLAAGAANLAIDLAAAGVKQGIDRTQLPPDQKNKIYQQIDRMTAAVKAGKIDAVKGEKFANDLLNGPFLRAAVAAGADAHYITPSGLTDAQKEEARRTFNRIIAGTLSHSIPAKDFDSLMEKIAHKKGPNQWEFKNDVSDDDLWSFVEEAQQVADDAGVPADVPRRIAFSA